MIPKTRFREDILATIHKDRILGIRAGSDSGHLVADLSRRSIWRNLRHSTQTGNQDPRGASAEEKMKEAVSAAYKEKYNTPGSVGYVAHIRANKV